MHALETSFGHLRVLVARELREFFHDRVGFALTIIAPVAAALLAAVSIGAPPKVSATVVIVGDITMVGDAGDLAALASASGASGAELRWEGVASVDAARQRVLSGDAAAAIVLPSNPTGTVRVISNRNEPIPASLAESAGHMISARLAAAQFLGNHPEANPPPRLTIVTVTPKGRVLNGAELYGPVIATFFLFLGAGFVARSLQAERERGTAARLRVIPVGSATIIGGKLVTMLLLGAMEFTAVLAFMSLGFGAHWGNPIAVIEVVGALTLAVGALAILVSSLARTVFMANSLQMLVALAFSALGGFLVPLQNLPDAARTVASYTPNGVAIRTMRDVATGQTGPAGVTGPVLLILTFAVVVAAIGFVNGRRVVET
jgi:ABC-2 type transport system permease protein